MKDDFSYENSHEENIKISIDKILGEPTSLRKVKRSIEEHKRSLFCKIIIALENLQERSTVLDEEFDMDMTKYDSLFYTLIDMLIELNFSKQQNNLINFYLYDRYNPDGTVSTLVDQNNTMIVLDTPEDLYNFLIKIK